MSQPFFPWKVRKRRGSGQKQRASETALGIAPADSIVIDLGVYRLVIRQSWDGKGVLISSEHGQRKGPPLALRISQNNQVVLWSEFSSDPDLPVSSPKQISVRNTKLEGAMTQQQEFYIIDLLRERDVPKSATCPEAKAFIAYQTTWPRLERPSAQEATELISWLKRLPKRRKLDKHLLDISETALDIPEE